MFTAMQTTLTLRGTHCASCKALIEEVSRELPGVTACSVDFRTGQTIIEHDATLDWAKFRQAIEQLGQYQVEPPAA